MAFELDPKEGIFAFPCSICKNNRQEVSYCRDTCGIYKMSNMEIHDLKADVQKLIYGYR